MERTKIILFICNWKPYGAFEDAGKMKFSYPARIYPVRVPCLGRVQPGIILKAFEKGAAGVLLAGCGDHCHHDFGYRSAEKFFFRAKNLVKLLGFPDSRLQLVSVFTRDAQVLVDEIRGFVERIAREGRPE